MEDYKKINMELLVAYLKGKENVDVDDIKQNAGLEPLRVYSMIAELHTIGKLTIVETEEMGAPKIVRLNEEH